MEWVNDLGTWFGKHWEAAIPILISLVAVAFTGFTMRYARSQRDSAKTQANAVEAQVDQMRRQNDLLEKQLEQTNGCVKEIPYVPPWSLKWHRGDTFELVNGGVEREYNISMEFPPHSAHDDGPWDYIDPRSSKTFAFAASLATPGRTVKVHWSRDPEGKDSFEWEGVLPPGN